MSENGGRFEKCGITYYHKRFFDTTNQTVRCLTVTLWKTFQFSFAIQLFSQNNGFPVFFFAASSI
ncbi:MAG: hypothetical protein IJ044_01825, partial [Oscillospiraceae bacterium]|nr:hypothetical protein [Oscillospiraceae bacterium]